jgi:DNA-binding NarL/FixJ family response regulator
VAVAHAVVQAIGDAILERMLELVAGGATLQDVADTVNSSLRTVNRRLAQARAVLGARTTAEAAPAVRRRRLRRR